MLRAPAFSCSASMGTVQQQQKPWWSAGTQQQPLPFAPMQQQPLAPSEMHSHRLPPSEVPCKRGAALLRAMVEGAGAPARRSGIGLKDWRAVSKVMANEVPCASPCPASNGIVTPVPLDTI